MGELKLEDVTIAYDTFGPDGGDPVVLVCGLSQPAGAWQLGMVPALVEAGFHVVTFDNRGVEPSSSPPAPYSIDQMVDDTLGLINHLNLPRVSIVGYSMGGWIAETLAFKHPERVRAAVFIGSCNEGTSWEKAITTVERDLARLDPELPHLFNAVETMRYLPNKELQQDGVVDLWLSLIGELPPWANPGRLGQYEAALEWSLDTERTDRWPALSVPCMVLSFEYDVDSPPERAKEAASKIPNSTFVTLAGASHLGVFTHSDAVAAQVVSFLSGNDGHAGP
jgi:pimeloyl-ACP methyl ester carboxylesterase